MGRKYIAPLSEDLAVYLGAVCKNDHRYKDTNKTLRRRSDRDCIECKSERSRKWEKENPRKYEAGRKQRDLRRVYGISWDDYHAMLEAQGTKCAICGGVEPNGQRLAVDHCHASGAVRSLLCSRCNSGLGQFRDSPDLLSKAREYLLHHEEMNSER